MLLTSNTVPRSANDACPTKSGANFRLVKVMQTTGIPSLREYDRWKNEADAGDTKVRGY